MMSLNVALQFCSATTCECCGNGPRPGNEVYRVHRTSQGPKGMMNPIDPRPFSFECFKCAMDNWNPVVKMGPFGSGIETLNDWVVEE